MDFIEDHHSRIFQPRFLFWRYSVIDQNFHFNTQGGLDFIGLDAPFYKKEDILSIIHPKDIPLFKHFFHNLRNKRSLGIQLRVHDKQGIIKWVNCFASYNRSNDQYEGWLDEITDFKRREIDLIISKNHFDKIEQISKTGSFSWTLSDEELTCSGNFFEIARLKDNKKGFLDKAQFFSLIDVESKNFVLDVMHDCITNQEDFDVSFQLAHVDGKRIRIYGYPIGSVSNPKIVGIIQEISEQLEKGHAVIKGQDIERKRISLEIHDSVGQKLIAVKYKLALFKMLKNLDGIDDLNAAMNEIIDEIRAITHNLSSQIVSEIGLKNALGQLLSETAKNLAAKKNYIFELKNINIPDEDSKMIYRIVQECLSNALKHSQAKTLSVSVKILNQQIVLRIEDDGKGFETGIYNKGIGLQNIKERVTTLNGFLKIESSPGNGSLIIIKIPLANGYKL
ncbi:MAG: PAS domain-containing sensor histidine kinase [Cyclobacteriaceae bacterium]